MEVWKPEKTEEVFWQWNLMVVLFQVVHNISLVILFQNLSLVHSNFGGLWGYKIFYFIFFLKVDSPRTQKFVMFLTYNADQTQKSNIEKAKVQCDFNWRSIDSVLRVLIVWVQRLTSSSFFT